MTAFDNVHWSLEPTPAARPAAGIGEGGQEQESEIQRLVEVLLTRVRLEMTLSTCFQ